MNIAHMKYFITAARCLNFSKAADQLYITQPYLSRQIAAIENELGLTLFIRDKRSVKLTPAGKILLEGFQTMYDNYYETVEKAQNIHKKLSGELNIGILDGEYIGDMVPPTLHFFKTFYPDLSINLENHSFRGINDRLYDGRLDLALTMYFDVKNRTGLQHRILEKNRDYLIVDKNHPLADREKVSLSDFKDDTFIMVSREDSEESSKLIIADCAEQGFFPRIQFASSVRDIMLKVESGVGVSILDGRNALRLNPSVKFLTIDSHFEPYLTLVWHQNNTNPMLKKFVEVFLSNLKNLSD